MARFIDIILRKSNRKEIHAALDNCIVISGDNVAQYLEETKKWTVNSVYDLPNIAPPFEQMFIEFTAPNGEHIGWYLYAYDRKTVDSLPTMYTLPDRIDEARWMIHSYMFVEHAPLIPQMTAEIFVASDGSLVECEPEIPFRIKPAVGSIYSERWMAEDQTLVEGVAGFFVGVMWTICFMNTKNVVQEDVHPEPKLNKSHQKKYRMPMRVYRVLKVSPMTRERGDGESKGGSHSAPSSHIRRGHFKHYSDDAPLFGRVVGTFWYNEVMVGKKERGEIVKDYEVSPE